MYNFFKYIRKHRIIFWSSVFILVVALSMLAARCGFEENIFKLLPETGDESFRVTFTNLKLKDKIFVQVVPTEEESDPMELAEALELFMDGVNEATVERNTVLYTLSYVDPFWLLDSVGGYVAQHMPCYLDVDAAMLDSLCSAKHIRHQLASYQDFLRTDMGDLASGMVGHDPCGIALGTVKKMLPDGTTLEELVQGAEESSRYMNGYLFAPDAKACLGFITPNFGTDNSREASRLVATMNEVKAKVREQYPNVDVLFHGSIVIAGGNSKQMRSDIYITVGIAMLIIFILLALCLKRPSYLMITIVALVFGVILAMAGIYIVQNSISLMSLGIGCVVLGVAFSYVLHVLIHYLYTGSIEMTLKEQTKPVLVG